MRGPLRSIVVLAALVALVVGSSSLPSGAAPRQGTLVTLRTQPAIKGVTFQLGDATFRTDARGIASTVVASSRRLSERLRVSPEVVGDPEQRVRLARWFTEDQEPGHIRATIALDVFVPTRFSFSSPQGPLGDESVSSMAIQSSVGERLTFEGSELGEAHWLFARRVVSRQGGPVVKPILYSVTSVIVDGADVVNRSELRFLPARDLSVDVPLLFYPADVRVRDAVFGTPVGRSIELTFPDGGVVRYPLEDGGRVQIPSLPRGRYSVSVQGPGLELTVPASITRSQEIDVRFLSYLDIAMGVLLALVFLIGLPLLGRRRARRRIQRSVRVQPVEPTVPSEKVLQ